MSLDPTLLAPMANAIRALSMDAVQAANSGHPGMPMGRCPTTWELLCSDVNRKVIEQAKVGIYPEMRIKNIPPDYLRRFCRKGVGSQEGNTRVNAELRQAVQFFTLNLHEDFPDLGQFDLVFLRNVLIYFENENKTKILERIASTLKPNGILFVGHSESLHGISSRFIPVKPAIYRLSAR